MGAYNQLLQWHVVAGFIAVAFTLVAFWIYNRNGSKINTGTWVILAIGDTLDLACFNRDTTLRKPLSKAARFCTVVFGKKLFAQAH